jgi:hypothetical protein
MESDKFLYSLKKIYFDTHIQILYRKNDIEAAEKRSHELDKLIEPLEAENARLVRFFCFFHKFFVFFNCRKI